MQGIEKILLNVPKIIRTVSRAYSPALRRLGQQDCKFKANLNCSVRCCLRRKKRKITYANYLEVSGIQA